MVNFNDLFTNSNSNYILNIILHIFILFTFLTIFFFLYISLLEKKELNDQVENIITKQTSDVLSNIDKIDKKINKKPEIQWKEINNISKKLYQNNIKEDPDVSKHNKFLFKLALGIIISLFLLIIFLFVYFSYYRKFNINTKRILLENLIIFSFIGLIEYLFFTYIASTYIPVTPEFFTTTILDRIKSKISI
jgi:predicted PurR-regulated permease PerM